MRSLMLGDDWIIEPKSFALGVLVGSKAQEIKQNEFYEDIPNYIQSTIEDKMKYYHAMEEERAAKMEAAVMDSWSDKCIPVPHFVYMSGSSLLLGFFIVCYCLWMFKNVLIIDPYFAFCGIIGSITLFLTAYKALDFWKEEVSKR